MFEVTANGIHHVVTGGYIGARKMNRPPRPLLFLGPSGVGKTVSVRESAKTIAKKLNEEYVDYADFSRQNTTEKEAYLAKIEQEGRSPFFFVDLMLLSQEPSDFSGIPREGELEGNRVTRFVPMEWAVLLSAHGGIVFLDELTNVNRDDLRGVAYKLIDERRTGSVILSNKVHIVAAGNRPDDSSIALPLPAPLLNRMAVYHVAPAKAEDWYQYASQKWENADPFLLGYLSKLAATPESSDAPETLLQFTTPRSCEYLLEEEQVWRSDGNEVDTKTMSALAISILGQKEGEMVSSWWAKRKDILNFLTDGSNQKMSPAALWAIGIYVGKATQSTSTKMDKTIVNQIGVIIRNIAKHGKEYLVPVYLGMGAFTKGSDPRESAQKVADMIEKINNKSDDYLIEQTIKKAKKPKSIFENLTPIQYFNGEFVNMFNGLSKGNEIVKNFVSVGERLLSDQIRDTLKELEKVKQVYDPLHVIVGDDFGKQIMNFDSITNWEDVVKTSQWKNETAN